MGSLISPESFMANQSLQSHSKTQGSLMSTISPLRPKITAQSLDKAIKEHLQSFDLIKEKEIQTSPQIKVNHFDPLTEKEINTSPQIKVKSIDPLTEKVIQTSPQIKVKCFDP